MDPRKASNAIVATVDFYATHTADLEGALAQKHEALQVALAQRTVLVRLQEEVGALRLFLESKYPDDCRSDETPIDMARRLLATGRSHP